MLILSRHRDESVIVDLRPYGLGLVVVAVVGIRGDKVRLGIEADASIAVHRQEVWDAIERDRLRDECGS